MRDLNTLVVGSGAREHTFFRAFGASERIQKLIWTPGNGGVDHHYRRDVSDSDVDGIVRLAKDEGINFVMIGPEAPLVGGLVDRLKVENIPAFGPTGRAAQLEASKIFTKTRCKRLGVPTADFDFAGDYRVAEKIIKERGFTVVKADGLCGGKGVVPASTEEEALQAAHDMLVKKIHGDAGSKIVLEERLSGRECSMMFICDGVHALALPPARDYKRIFDGDKGPNTGGMGTYSPLPDVSPEMVEDVRTRFIIPFLGAMAERREPFHGCLYAGLMLTNEGPKLIEFNVRFGDPETQAVLPRIACDIIDYLLASVTFGGLRGMKPIPVKASAVVGVTLATKGYPGTPEKGALISCHTNSVYHAGTARQDGLRVAGGRVMTVYGEGETVQDARDHAYENVRKVNWNGMHYRTDIAEKP
ncbi:MAG: phosphoribosylamine--glycine ligase [Methylomonas sp.]|nr:phosphoribosylamine--glycine ligase [Methylomonas sp.]